MVIKNFQLQYLYLGISLFSCFCIINNFYIIYCSNFVGFICLIDFYYIKKKDMILHHILVLIMLHYMNNHSYVENKNEIVSIILKTEISTIFLTINNLLDTVDNMVILKNINKCIFIFTFIYYRIYNYSYYLILNKNIHNIFLFYSKNNFELYEIYTGIYGLFILNLYWTFLIFKKVLDWSESIKCSKKAKYMK